MIAGCIFLLALWLWFCMVVSDGERPLIAAVFLVPFMTVHFLRRFFDWLDDLIFDDINEKLGNW